MLKTISKAKKEALVRWINDCIKNQSLFLKQFGISKDDILNSDQLLDDIVWNYAKDDLKVVSGWNDSDETKNFVNSEISRLYDAIENEE